MVLLGFATSAALRTEMEAALRACGYEISLFDAEERAWSAFEQLRPEIVVVQGDDAHLPFVRRVKDTGNAYVLAIVPDAQSRFAALLRQGGVDDFLLPGQSPEQWAARIAVPRMDRLGGVRTGAELEVRVRQQAAVAEIGRRALAHPDLEAFMGFSVKAVAKAIDVPLCLVLEWLPNGDGVVARAGVGWKEAVIGSTFPGTLFAAWRGAGEQGLHVFVDLAQDPHLHRVGLLRDHQVVSGLSVPIGGTTTSYGLLAAFARTRRAFEQADVNFLQAVASILATAVEQQRAEEALRDSEARVRAILETTVDGIISIDTEGRIVAFNAAAERIFGYTAEEVLGENVSVLMPPPYREEHDDYLRSYLETGHRKIIGIGREVTGQRKDGSVFPMDLAVSEVTLGGRRVFTGIVRDITERRQLEQEILQTSEQERRRIGQDLHDGLGQMLTGIGLISQNLARKLKANAIPGADEVAEITELIKEADQQARSLARGLVPVDLEANGLVTALHRLTTNAERLFGITCTFESVGTAAFHDSTAATHLYRIAQEAVSNAVKHGKATQVTVSLAMGEDQTRLRIVDNGIGFPPVLTKESGMGVRIMHYRARMIGGTLEIASGVDGGTTVTCTLRRTPSVVGRAPSPTRDTGGGPRSRTTTH